MISRKLEVEGCYEFQYTICTLVTDQKQYDEMVQSFIASGFDSDKCEFLIADNTELNKFDAFRAFNRFIREARGKYVIICHQDVLIEHDDEAVLSRRLEHLNHFDPNWGVAGNAGAQDLYHTPMVITQNEQLIRKGDLPAKVSSLDENFLLLKAESNLAVAGDISGFHFYGTDICLIANCLGWNCYVIDYHITHKSSGRVNPSFDDISTQLQTKYKRFFRGRYIRTTITRFYLGSYWVSWFMNMSLIKSLVRAFYKFKVIKNSDV